MQCSVCETRLPQGVAYCPSCGSMTPYHVASTGVSPSDATVTSSSVKEQLSEYPTIPPNPYDTPYSMPYDTPSLTPPPPPPLPPQNRRLVALSITVLIILVLIGGAGGILYFRGGAFSGQSQSSASPTTQAGLPTTTPASTTQATVVSSPTIQATAASSEQTPQDLYTQITQTTPVLDDPLRINGASGWAENTSASGSCAFTEGAYHASVQQNDSYMLCMAQDTNFSDLAYQVEMTIVKGELGGMVFRTDSTHSKYYTFFIERSGNYTLITSVDDTGTQDRVLHKGTSTYIKTGLNETNLLTIIARGSSIYLYINQQYIASASDSTYQAGKIGVFGGTFTQVPADVVFSRIQVWEA